MLIWITTDLVQNVFRQPRLGTVLVRDTVHGRDGLSLSSFGEQELWRFVEMEEEESADEHSKGDGAK